MHQVNEKLVSATPRSPVTQDVHNSVSVLDPIATNYKLLSIDESLYTQFPTHFKPCVHDFIVEATPKIRGYTDTNWNWLKCSSQVAIEMTQLSSKKLRCSPAFVFYEGNLGAWICQAAVAGQYFIGFPQKIKSEAKMSAMRIAHICIFHDIRGYAKPLIEPEYTFDTPNRTKLVELCRQNALPLPKFSCTVADPVTFGIEGFHGHVDIVDNLFTSDKVYPTKAAALEAACAEAINNVGVIAKRSHVERMDVKLRLPTKHEPISTPAVVLGSGTVPEYMYFDLYKRARHLLIAMSTYSMPLDDALGLLGRIPVKGDELFYYCDRHDVAYSDDTDCSKCSREIRTRIKEELVRSSFRGPLFGEMDSQSTDKFHEFVGKNAKKKQARKEKKSPWVGAQVRVLEKGLKTATPAELQSAGVHVKHHPHDKNFYATASEVDLIRQTLKLVGEAPVDVKLKKLQKEIDRSRSVKIDNRRDQKKVAQTTHLYGEIGGFLDSIGTMAASIKEGAGELSKFREILNQFTVENVMKQAATYLPAVLALVFSTYKALTDSVNRAAWIAVASFSMLYLATVDVVLKPFFEKHICPLFDQFINGLTPNLVAPEAGITGEQCGQIGRVVALAISAFSLGTANASNIVVVLRGLSDFPKIQEGCTGLLEGIIKCIQWCFNKIGDYFNFSKVELFQSACPEYDRWVKDSEVILASHAKRTFAITGENHDRVVRLIMEGLKLNTELAHHKVMEKVRAGVFEVIRGLKEVARVFDNSNVRTSFTRPTPLCLRFIGSPGVGKSFCLLPFITCLCAMTLPADQLEQFRKEPSRFVYMREQELKYWDGYTGQWITVIDDLGQNVAVPGNADNEWMDLIRMYGDFSHICHMADISLKGNVVFQSRIVIATTNQPTTQTTAIYDTKAIDRRFDLSYRIFPHPDFAKNYKSSDPVLSSNPLDWCIDKSKLSGVFNKNAIQFQAVDPNTGFTTGSILTFEDIMRASLEKFKSHETKGERLATFLTDLRTHATRVRGALESVEVEPQYKDRVYEQSLRRVLQLADSKDPLHKQYPQPQAETPVSHPNPASVPLEFNAPNQAKGKEPATFVFGGPDHPVVAPVPPCLQGEVGGDDSSGLFYWIRRKLSRETRYPYDPIMQMANNPFLAEMPEETPFQSASAYIRSVPAELASELKEVCDAYGLNLEWLVHKSEDVRREIRYSITSYWFAKPFGGSRRVLDNLKRKVADIIQQSRFLVIRATQAIASLATWFENLKQKLVAWWAGFDTFLWIKRALVFGAVACAGLGLYNGVTGVVTTHRAIKAVERIEAVADVVEKTYIERSLDDLETEAANSDQWEGKKQVQHRIKTRVVARKEPARVKGEIGSDPNCDALMVKLFKKNVYALHFLGNVNQFGCCTFVADRIALIPLHYVSDLKVRVQHGSLKATETIQLFNLSYRAEGLKVTVQNFLDAKSPPRLEECDLALVKFDKSIPSAPNIVENFVDRATLSKEHDYNIQTIMLRGDKEKIPKIFEADRARFLKELQGEHSVHDELITWVSARGILYNLPTDVGDCGVPVLLRSPFVRGHRILGIHTAGDHGTIGYASCITSEDLSEALVTAYGRLEPEIDNRAVLKYTSEEVQVPGGGFNVLRTDTPVGMASRTQIKRSELFEGWGPHITEPAVLRPVERNGVVIDPWPKALERYKKADPLFPPWLIEVIRAAARAEFEVIAKAVPKQNREPVKQCLTFEEAVKGIGEWLKRIPLDTSPGYPWVLDRHLSEPGKSHWFKVDKEGNWDLTAVACEALKERCEHIVECAKKGIRLEHVCLDALKDERRKISRIEAVETRFISGAPLDYFIACRMLFGSYASFYIQGRILNGSAIGVNPHSHEWEVILQYLQEVGRDFLAGDYIGLDSSTAVLIWDIIGDEIINRFYSDFNKSYDVEFDHLDLELEPEKFYQPNSQSDQYNKARKVLLEDLYNSHHILGGIVYEWLSHLPSGHFLTAVGNTTYIGVTKRVVYALNAYRDPLKGLPLIPEKCPIQAVLSWTPTQAQLAEMKRLTFEFTQFVRSIRLGDDHAAVVHSTKKDVFNMFALERWCPLLGMQYTDAKKNPVTVATMNLADVTFLKRSWRYDKINGRHLAALELSVILEMPYWTKHASNAKEITLSNFDTAMHYLSMHSEEVFNEWAPKMIKAYTNTFGLAYSKDRDVLLCETLAICDRF